MTQLPPSITIEGIEKLALSSKKVVTETGISHVSKISFEGDFRVGDVARLLYLSKQGKPINICFECPQAEFDLTVTPYSVKTGEIAPSELPLTLK